MNDETIFLKICSTSRLDGKRTVSIRFLKIVKVEYFDNKSKLKGEIKKIYFTDNGNEKYLIRHCLPNSNIPSQYKTLRLKTPRDFDEYSSFANCTIVKKSRIEDDHFTAKLI